MAIIDISGLAGGIAYNYITMCHFTRPVDFDGDSVISVVNELSQTIPALENAGYGQKRTMLYNAVQQRKQYLLDAQVNYYTNGDEAGYEKVAHYIADVLQRLDVAMNVSTQIMLDSGVNPPRRELRTRNR